MTGIYFSGTGNSGYAAELFCKEYDKAAKAFSIEDDAAIPAAQNEEMLVFAYPVQYSTVPKILRDYILEHKELWKNKKIFIIATMGLFVKKAEQKIRKSVRLLKSGKPTREGIGLLYRMAGFFGQRLYFGHKTKHYSDKLRVDEDKCIGCGKCEKLCPMKNIEIVEKKVVQKNRCTMCYRCINHCPKQAMTLLGKAVVEQSVIAKYL